VNGRFVKYIVIILVAVVLGDATKWLLKSVLLPSHHILDDLLAVAVIVGVIYCPHLFPKLFNGKCPICGRVLVTH
jgi:hypothetical protein